MARGWTDTGPEVFISEGQHFSATDNLENREARERERGREVGKEEWRDQQVFSPDGA